MFSGVKVSGGDRKNLKWLDHPVFSWTLDDLTAVVDDDFFDSVRDVLDANISLDERPLPLPKAKRKKQSNLERRRN